MLITSAFVFFFKSGTSTCLILSESSVFKYILPDLSIIVPALGNCFVTLLSGFLEFNTTFIPSAFAISFTSFTVLPTKSFVFISLAFASVLYAFVTNFVFVNISFNICDTTGAAT